MSFVSYVAWSANACHCPLLPTSTLPVWTCPPTLPVQSNYWGHIQIWQASSAGRAERGSAQAADILRKLSETELAVASGLTMTSPPSVPLERPMSLFYQRLFLTILHCNFLAFNVTRLFMFTRQSHVSHTVYPSPAGLRRAKICTDSVMFAAWAACVIG